MVSTLIVTQEGVVVATQLDTTLIAMLASTLVPLLVSFVTKQSASDGLRSVVNIAGSVLMAVIALWLNPSDLAITWQVVANTALVSLIASFTAYKAFWKPTGIAGSIAAKTSDFGLGSPPLVETSDKGAEDLNEGNGL